MKNSKLLLQKREEPSKHQQQNVYIIFLIQLYLVVTNYFSLIISPLTATKTCILWI